MRIRICQFTPCLWSGGTEERIARVIAALDRDVFEPSWIGFGAVREALVEKAGGNVGIVPIDRHPAGGIEPSVILRIASALSRLRPHVMHIHNWSTSLYGIAGARFAGVPRVIFGVGGREDSEGASARRRKAMRALAPHLDRFTAVCDFLAAELAEDFGVERDRVSVLRTGVDVARIDRAQKRDKVLERFRIPKDATVIGAVSVFRPVKRIPDLIDAVGEIAKERPNVHLLLVGNPVRVSVAELRSRAAARGLADRVHLVGRVEDSSSVLKAFDVFVNCSLFEGSSNAIIEAMAASIPVVGTAVGGTPELVRDGKTGLLVPPENATALASAIARLVDDPEIRKTMGAAGRAWARTHHTQDGMFSSYTNLYKSEAASMRRTVLGRRWSTLRATAESIRVASG